MHVVMTTVLSVWIATNAYREAPHDATTKFVHRSPAEARKADGGRLTVVRVGFKFRAGTMVRCGPDGCEITHDFQMIKEKEK